MRLALLLSTLLLSPAAHGRPAQDPPPPPAPRGADPSPDARRLGSPPALPANTLEEDTWRAATAEEWRRPVLVKWQRSFEDALRVARREGRPILVAVNMDGEIASEHFAGVRYRSPETAALLEPYVCLIASTYRHTARDYDEEGRRIPCPRFGTVTCGEHIQVERELYGRYFDGRRIAPRHLVLDLDAHKSMDVYYAWDTRSVLRGFAEGAAGWPEPRPEGKLDLEELLTSPRVEHREELERRYASADSAGRRTLLRTLITVHARTRDAPDQVDLLRLAAFGFDREAARLARRALAQCHGDAALDLCAELLKTPLGEGERSMLLAAVQRMAADLPRARALASIQSGLALDSALLDSGQAQESPSEEPDDALALLAQARTTTDHKLRGLLQEDAAQRLAGEADPGEEARDLAARALFARDAGELSEARRLALLAVEAGLYRGGGAPGGELGCELLHLFAQERTAAIHAAYRRGEGWPPEWISDAHAAYVRLEEEEKRPEILGGIYLEHYDFLHWIGAERFEGELLSKALERFPASAALHERLRARLLGRGGPAALEEEYRRREEGEEGLYFAGYAYLVAAEAYRRTGRDPEARQAYTRAEESFERGATRRPEQADAYRHYQVLALAGRARLSLEAGEPARAAAELIRALELRPASAKRADGLGFTPLMTAKMVHARLVEQEPQAARESAMETGLEEAIRRIESPGR